ncbi:hypothetical protein FRC17_000162 [Serendipita sp. 399]|nr:hypothetical protein FRC17_000162 [Serendipita sp. 399]
MITRPTTLAYLLATVSTPVDQICHSEGLLEKFVKSLDRQRTFQEEANTEMIREFLSDRYYDYFLQGESQNKLSSITPSEAIHYEVLIKSGKLYTSEMFKQGKELCMHCLVWYLTIRNRQDAGLKFAFPSRWEFPLVAFLRESNTRVKYNPASDGMFKVHNMPYMIMEIASGNDGKDRFWMQLQAAGLARFGNLQGVRRSRENPFIVTAIYISNEFKSSRYLFVQPDTKNKEVLYTEKQFDLANPEENFRLLFELYNIPDVTREHNGDPYEEFISNVASEIKKRIPRTLTGVDSTNPNTDGGNASGGNAGGGNAGGENAGGGTQVGGKKRKRLDDTMESLSTADRLITDAGYTFTDQDEELESMLPLSAKLREAIAPSGSSVILKYVPPRSSEMEVLKDLNERQGPSNHIIELLDVIYLTTGQMIALPEYVPLPLAGIGWIPTISIISSLQEQFLEGVEFMHRHGVAHLDLKPDNVVLDFRKGDNPPTLFIIDFNTAVRVSGVNTMRKGVRGTRGWIAPEVSSNENEYSPILADRWACGKLVKYLWGNLEMPTQMEERCHKWMNRNPAMRPYLLDANIQPRRIAPSAQTGPADG